MAEHRRLLERASILLVEDDAALRAAIAQALAGLGASVTEADDGRSAFAIAREKPEPFELVVADIEMPRMSGLELFAAIRQLKPPHGQMPILAITGFTDPAQTRRIREAGADAIVQKPVPPMGDLARVLRWLILAGPGRADVDLVAFFGLQQAIGWDALTRVMERIPIDLDKAGAALDTALDQRDAAAVSGSCHMIVGVGGVIGAEGVTGLARETSAAAKSGDWSATRRLAARLRLACEGLRGFARYVTG
ncbi:MAG: response regulator [Rubricella sp.]